MEDTIVFYTSPEHLNSTAIMAKSVANHHPSVPVVIISTAPEPAVGGPSVDSITYRRIPTVDLPPDLTKDPLELFFEIPRLNNGNLRQALVEISTTAKIRALVIDFFCNAAFEVGRSLNIPTYYDVSSCASALCVFLYFPTFHDAVDGNIGDMNEFIQVPGCPPIHSSDFPMIMCRRESNAYGHTLDVARNMRRSAGILVNSFDALELRAKEAIEKGLCVPHAPTPPVYFFGPLLEDSSNRGADGGRHECLTWLDSQPRKSVVFLCFGRRGSLSAPQLRELAVGLEESGHRFLWSVRCPRGARQLEEPGCLNRVLLPEGFSERTRERGMVIMSWAPQREILSHPSVGGFVTHCGVSSLLEAVSSGVPMIGWPLYAEQKMNRTFMVEEMKVALPLDVEATGDGGGFVSKEEVERRVRELMGPSEKGRLVGERVEELKRESENAVRDADGSSVVAVRRFVEAVMTC